MGYAIGYFRSALWVVIREKFMLSQRDTHTQKKGKMVLKEKKKVSCVANAAKYNENTS